MLTCTLHWVSPTCGSVLAHDCHLQLAAGYIRDVCVRFHHAFFQRPPRFLQECRAVSALLILAGVVIMKLPEPWWIRPCNRTLFTRLPSKRSAYLTLSRQTQSGRESEGATLASGTRKAGKIPASKELQANSALRVLPAQPPIPASTDGNNLPEMAARSARNTDGRNGIDGNRALSGKWRRWHQALRYITPVACVMTT